MTTPEKSRSNGKTTKGTKRVKRKAPARSGPIRTSVDLPQDHHDYHAQAHHQGHPVGMSPQTEANVQLDEGLINKAVADAVRSANKVLNDTVAQGRIAAEHFRHGDYNMRDVPVDVQILGQRMIKLARELSETTLSICEQLLRQLTQIPTPPRPGVPGKVPPFPTGTGSTAAPPSSHASPSADPARDDRVLPLAVVFTGNQAAKALPSPLWKPQKPTSPQQLHITPLQPLGGKGKQIEGVSFSVDIGGALTATVPVPAGQAPGVYAGMVTTDSQGAPLGVLTIEVVG
ncbi:hypothetical protein [Erythrobacter mangrovi]|uniref:Uncharacterized protein n=1 Tax=Erythrobacter mangrovi TaxID=2739433 RepID=A0A7D4AVB1_9SPHN|nr:hypothetical protein [Erythrobacter mangrovi]QKG72557.1 hypothetical protein HQR01_14955 [Erythrobacter mangrovi]